MATEFVQKLSLLADDGQTFFDEENMRYEVPIYQRAFAWGTKFQDVDRPNEIDQLMDDIAGAIPEDAVAGDKIVPYFLGSMVVKKSIKTHLSLMLIQALLISLSIHIPII